MSNENTTNYGTGCAAARELYEGSVGLRALERVGRNQNLKGVAHEVMFTDILNANPQNIASGTKAVLTKATNAVRDDVILKQGGTVVGRYQLKDTAKSIRDTVNQVKSGHYVGTNLVGTTETVNAYGKAVANEAKRGVEVTQKMTSSGISSSDTSRIAIKTIGSSAGNLSAKAVAKVAGGSGLTGAAISGLIEVVSAGKDWAEGDIDGEEFVGRVAKETVGGGLSAAGGSALATVASAGAATVLASTTAPVWIPAAIGLGVAVAVGTGIKKLWDLIWE